MAEGVQDHNPVEGQNQLVADLEINDNKYEQNAYG